MHLVFINCVSTVVLLKVNSQLPCVCNICTEYNQSDFVPYAPLCIVC